MSSAQGGKRTSRLLQWCFDQFLLDPATTCLWWRDQLVPLPPKPFAVLAYLVAHAGRVVTKDELLEAVWPETVVSEGVLKTCMGQIRQVLGETARMPQYIATVHRRGYRFIAPVTAIEPAPTAPTTASPFHTPLHVRPEGSQTLSSPPIRMVAREAELARLHQCWRHALQGTRQLVFITGEAGIGKTTLVDAFVGQVASAEAVWLGRGQCIEQYGAGEAYLPLLEALGQLGRSPDGARLVDLLRQQAPSWLRQMPALLSTTEYEELQRRRSETTRERMLRELAEAVETLTAARPLVLLLEDLHWSDYATLDWLALVARRRAEARLLVLGTYRPADAIARAHPIRPLTQELQRHGQCTELLVPYLPEAGVAAYLVQRFGEARVPEGLAHALHQRTNGNPFFLVTVVEELARQGRLGSPAASWTRWEDLAAVVAGVPESVRQLIEAQLGQVSLQEQEILAAASVAGTEFSAAAVAAAVGQAPEDVEARCDILARRGQFVRPQGVAEWSDGTAAARYHFVHDLYHEVLYEQVPVNRRMRWHRQIGARLEAGYGPRAREIAAELAMHFERGRDSRRAVVYLQYAADNALRRYANVEAIAHLTKALALLKAFPNPHAHLQQELDLLTALGPAFAATKGYGALEVEHTYTRARELCQQLGDPLQLSQVLWGLLTCYLVRAEHQIARELAEQLVTLAQRQLDTALLFVGHFALGAALYCLGASAPAREHLEQSIALDDPQQSRAHPFLFGMDLGVFCRSWASHALWHLGYPDQALSMSHTALARARELSHPFSLALALNYAAILHQFRCEEGATHERAEAATVLCREHGFAYYLAWGPILQGWVLVEQGQGEAGIAQMRDGLAAFRVTGGKVRLPYYLALLAKACGDTGQTAAGLRLVTEALAHAETTGEGWWQPELYRLKAELRLQEGGAQAMREAEESFRVALTVARRQQAKSLELRAAMSLSRLWQQQGKREEARQLLTPIYAWFTEGFDTADLQEAAALLDALRV
jgi:predicted ATPase/DNA-binding winged helix-turn-helix (wHTH) protein